MFKIFSMPLSKPVVIAPYNSDGKINPYFCTPESNFGCMANARILKDIFDDSPQNDLVWQPDLYHEARKAADAIGARRIIDIGCGNALKLKNIFEHDGLEIIGMDFAASLTAARQNFPNAIILECDLTSWNETLQMFRELSSYTEPTIIIAGDVIERLPDPRPFLAMIRQLLSVNDSSKAFISTPDRARLNYPDVMNKPKNPAHIREWSLNELGDHLSSAGFKLINVGNIRANQMDDRHTTCFVECRFDSNEYNSHLMRLGFPYGSNTKHVMLTSEYPGVNPSGGIGTFVLNWHSNNADSAVLIAQNIDFISDECQQDVVMPSDIINYYKGDEIGVPDLMLMCISQILFYLPLVESIHYQDYLGIGYRIAQAKSSGILPDSLINVAHCHGNQHYLENANQEWFKLGLSPVAYQEKLSIELADIVVFPAEYLKNQYTDSGIDLTKQQIKTVPYWYPMNNIQYEKFQRFDKIVFVGKYLPMKGYDLFCEALDNKFCQILKQKGIREIVFIGRNEGVKFPNEEYIRKYFSVVEYNDFGLDALHSYIRRENASSLFIEPYRADNFPIAVYDVVANGGTLIAANAGGIPEIFDDSLWNECLFELNHGSLRMRVLEVLDWPHSRREEIRDALIKSLYANNSRSNGEIYGVPNRSKVVLLTSTVMIPFYNTNISELEDLFHALNQQSRKPDEIIIVNDASNYNERDSMAHSAKKILRVPYRIIDHQFNQGLAAARNTALNACTTDIIINADSDDIPLTNWVKNIVNALSRNPDAATAVPYLSAFDAGDDFNVWDRSGKFTYRPVGDGFVLSQTQNLLGHANSGYRVSAAKAIDGWGAHSKAKYEDWAFFLSVLAHRFRIEIIPSIDCLYRVRKNSMARTYSEWPGQLRLFHINCTLSRFELLELQRLSRTSYAPVAQFHSDYEKLKNRKVIRITDWCGNRLSRFPFLYRTVKLSAKLTWTMLLRLRKALRKL